MDERERQDAFTLADRKELMRHGITLEKIERDLDGMKVLVNEEFQRRENQERRTSMVFEGRVRGLEDARIEARAQIRTFLWIASIVGAAFGTLMHVFLERLFR